MPYFLRKIVLRRLEDAKTTVRCVSSELADRLSRLVHSRLTPRIRVEISPIDVHVDLTRSELRKMLGIGPEPLVIIAARLVPSKRVDVALQAATLLPGARVVVCGNGPEFRRLKKRFSAATFLGRLPRQQLLEWIAAADLLLCASRDEGAPSVVREARALGVPVVATTAGDLKKWAETDVGLSVVP
jgi:glycosyltransferase involved in cell wall biosynthesis